MSKLMYSTVMASMILVNLTLLLFDLSFNGNLKWVMIAPVISIAVIITLWVKGWKYTI